MVDNWGARHRASMEFHATPPLRFAVGDRVRCKTGARSWKRGQIVKLHYREESWPQGEVAPYQIQLDAGVLIFAPEDSDCLIQADDGMAEEADCGAEVHVCQAGPCRRAGGEAVLLEIEELANSVGGVTVEPSGCLGNCSQAPNALLVSGESERIFAKLCDLSSTAHVVELASGKAPSLEDAEMVKRLERARRLRARMEAREESKWNLALSGLAEDVERAESEEDRAELTQEYAELLAAAGFGEKALETFSNAGLDRLSLRDIPKLRLLLDQAKILLRLGRVADVDAARTRVEQLQPLSSNEGRVRAQVVQLLEEMIFESQGEQQRIQDYARWRLDHITPVSKHSAVYHFRTDDASRGTPIRKGRGGRTVWSKTWHTTLLAEVGEECNKEGPLPWIERDYTPISTAHDWENGRCDILIKIYLEPAGLATEWLHRISAAAVARAVGAETDSDADAPEAAVWLSKPMKTLHVPSLAIGDEYINRRHASVLLLVAGTGVVAVPQVLHHANATTCFGGRPPVTQPVSVIYSCRSDDALLIPELAGLCREGSLRRCTVLVTASQSAKTPFPGVADTDVAAAFSEVDNAVCVNARLSPEILRSELTRLQKPLRVVVSGPAGFNGACKSMLKQLDDELGPEAVTILSA